MYVILIIHTTLSENNFNYPSRGQQQYIYICCFHCYPLVKFDGVILFKFGNIDMLTCRKPDCAVFGQINLKKLSKNVAKLENWNCKVIFCRIQFCQVFVVWGLKLSLFLGIFVLIKLLGLVNHVLETLRPLL